MDMLSFSKLTEEQKNAEVSKMGDGYEKWQESLERIGTIGMFEKSLSEDEIGKITKCDSHTKLGESKDGKYSYYLSVNSTADAETIEELKQTTVEITEKKDVRKTALFLSEKVRFGKYHGFFHRFPKCSYGLKQSSDSGY